MRFRCLVLGVVLTVFAAGCDTEQPAQAGARQLLIEFAAAGITVSSFFVWEVTDTMSPTPNTSLVCEPAADQTVAGPWYHSAEIAIIPAGETEQQLLSSEDASATDTANLTPYSEFAQPNARLCPLMPPPNAPPCPDASGRFVYSPANILTQANRLLLEGGPNDVPRFGCPPTNYQLTGSQLEEPGVDQRSPFVVSINPGDTVIVKARRSLTEPQGLGAKTTPSFSATLTIDGAVVGSDDDVQDGVSVSYTSR